MRGRRCPKTYTSDRSQVYKSAFGQNGPAYAPFAFFGAFASPRSSWPAKDAQSVVQYAAYISGIKEHTL